MSIIVMKFGGTSLADIDKINNVAEIVKKEVSSHKLIVVLSAMAGETNKLQNYLDEINSESLIENDLVLTSGEQITIGLLSSILSNPYILGKPLSSMIVMYLIFAFKDKDLPWNPKQLPSLS